MTWTETACCARFVEWFEREEISAKFDKFIATHAAEMSSNSGVESEQSHDWWPLYQLYQSQFEAHLETFLSTAGISKDEFLAAAAGASGINEMYLQIFLVHSEYET